MPTHHTTCPLCEALCGLEIETQGSEILSIKGHEGDPLSRGHICPKAIALQDLHDDPDRLRQPMRREGASWRPVSWDEALDEAADRLHAVQAEHGLNAVATYAGNPTAHSYSMLLAITEFQSAIGTRNRYSATSADQLPHMFAALSMFGHQLLLPVPDIDRTHLWVIFGANPAASNGSLMTAPGVAARAKALRKRGGRIVLFDPRRTETARWVDEHHFVKPGSDALVMLAILNVLFDRDWTDPGAWRGYSRGLEALKDVAAGFPPSRVAGVTGVDEAQIVATARAIHEAKSAAIYGRMGVSTQRFGGLCAWLVYALNIVTGNLDRPGGMMFTTPAVDLVGLAAKTGNTGHFARGHSRVSKRPEFGGEYPVSVLAEEMETAGDGQIRALITMAGNPVLSTPNGDRLDRALAGLDFMVSFDWYVTATTRHANLILPPVSALERDHYGLAFHALAVRNTAKYCLPLFPPPEGAREDWDLVLDLAVRLHKRRGRGGPKSRAGVLRRLTPRRVLDLALRTGRHGAWRHPLKGHKLTLKKLGEMSGGVDLGPLQAVLPARLYTRDGQIDLAPEVLVADVERLEAELDDGDADGLVLIGRRHVRSCNSWLHNSERLVRGKDRCTLLIHPEDAASRGVEDGGSVTVSSRVGEVEVRAEVDDSVMPGVVSLPHGWGHGRKGVKLSVATAHAGVSINDLTDELHIDELTGNSGFSGVPVEVVASGQG